jgi:pimeloyl-ACP methyl ester carboxylesterase
MIHPLLDLGGRGSLLHLAPANGFPPATYLPALDPLLDSFRVVSLPPRAMWPGIGPPPPADSWDPLASDLLEGMTRHRLEPVIAVGHSFGAVISLLAAVREPARFRALIMLDPVIFTPAIYAELESQRRGGEAGFRPLVEGARKRRRAFASGEDAFIYWRERPLFADWSDDAVRRYVRAMLRPDDGGGYTLTWSPVWEGHYYESVHAGTWEALGRLSPSLPVLVVAGARSETPLPEAVAMLKERLPAGALRLLEGRGHLFPQSAPRETGELLRDWLSLLPAAPAP